MLLQMYTQSQGPRMYILGKPQAWVHMICAMVPYWWALNKSAFNKHHYNQL